MRQHLRNIGLIFALSFNSIAYADRYGVCDVEDGCYSSSNNPIGALLFIVIWWWLAVIYRPLRIIYSIIFGLIGVGGFIHQVSSHNTSFFKILLSMMLISSVAALWFFCEKGTLNEAQRTNASDVDELNNTASLPPPSQQVYENEPKEKAVYNDAVLKHIGESNRREIVRLNNSKLALVTELDVEVFGEDTINICRKAFEEAKHIKNPILLYELPSKYLTEEDEEIFGGDLLYLARRVVKDVKTRKAKSMREPTASKLVFEFDEEQFGSDLVDLFYRIAQEELSHEYM